MCRSVSSGNTLWKICWEKFAILNAEGFRGEGTASLSLQELAQRTVREKARQ